MKIITDLQMKNRYKKKRERERDKVKKKIKKNKKIFSYYFLSYTSIAAPGIANPTDHEMFSWT